MSGFIKTWATVALLFFAAQLLAQPSNPPITLKQLLNRVNEKAPVLLTDSTAIRIRQAQATEVRNNWLPNLRLNYQADVGSVNNVAGPYFGFGIIPSSSAGVRAESNTSAAGINLGIAAFDWEVYNFGAYGAANRVANSDVKVEQFQYAQSKYQLQAYTIDNYLQLMLFEDYLTIQRNNINRNLEILRSVSSLAKSGVRPGVDTSIAQAELSSARLSYIELTNQFKKTQVNLSVLSDLPYQDIIPDTAAQNQLVNHNIALPSITADTSNHPVVAYYKSLLQDNLQREDLVRKQYNPKILVEGAAWGRGSSVDASDQYHSVGSGFDMQRGNYLVGLGISYNLFDLRRRQLKLRTQKTETDYARNKLEEQKTLLYANAQQADVEMATAIDRLHEIPVQLKAAEAGYRQKLSLYRSGLTDIIELNAALNILLRAETDYAQARYAYNNALFQKAITDNQVNTVLNQLK